MNSLSAKEVNRDYYIVLIISITCSTFTYPKSFDTACPTPLTIVYPESLLLGFKRGLMVSQTLRYFYFPIF